MMGLAPIMMLPSCDKEVIALQKEVSFFFKKSDISFFAEIIEHYLIFIFTMFQLLTRQLALQRLQEKVLRAQYAHYGQLMNNGEPMHGSVITEEIVEVSVFQTSQN